MRILSTITILAFLGSCAAPPKPLVEVKPLFPTMEVALLESEEKMVISLAQAPSSGGTYYTPIQMPAGTSAGTAAAASAGAGLLAALIVGAINSVQQSNAKKDVAPVQEALGDTKFGPAILEAVAEALPRLSWTKLDKIANVNLEEAGGLAEVVHSSNSTGLLTVSTNSFLSRDADTLVFVANAVILPVPEKSEDGTNSKKRKRVPSSAYGATVSYEVPAPVEGRKRQDFIPAWAANRGAAIKAAAAQATPKIADLIVRQLQEGKTAIVENEDGKFERRNTSAYGQRLREKVQVLSTSSEGELVRAQNGALRFYANPISQSVAMQFAPSAPPMVGQPDMGMSEDMSVSDDIKASEDMGVSDDMDIIPEEMDLEREAAPTS